MANKFIHPNFQMPETYYKVCIKCFNECENFESKKSLNVETLVIAYLKFVTII